MFQCLRRGISHFFLYNKTLKKLYRPSKYLEKSWNFALAKMEETCLSCVLDTKLCAEWKINPLPYVLSAFRTIREVMRGRGGELLLAQFFPLHLVCRNWKFLFDIHLGKNFSKSLSLK